MIVLDTNVISELMRPLPEPRVLGWLAAQPAASVFATTVTQAELLYVVAVISAGRRSWKTNSKTVDPQPYVRRPW